MLNYMIVVDDSGELKTVTAKELSQWPYLASVLDERLNQILDARAIAAGEYDPSDNDTPIVMEDVE